LWILNLQWTSLSPVVQVHCGFQLRKHEIFNYCIKTNLTDALWQTNVNSWKSASGFWALRVHRYFLLTLSAALRCPILTLALVFAGVYGDVHRVKILFNKKDNALIQMADPHQAQLGINFTFLFFCLVI